MEGVSWEYTPSPKPGNESLTKRIRISEGIRICIPTILLGSGEYFVDDLGGLDVAVSRFAVPAVAPADPEADADGEEDGDGEADAGADYAVVGVGGGLAVAGVVDFQGAKG